MQGKVKWFSNEWGFGFITSEEVKDDIFVHYSAIQMRGYRSLEKDVHLVKGNRGNLKITTPEDVYIFKAFLEFKESKQAFEII